MAPNKSIKHNPLDDEISTEIDLSACPECGLWGCTGLHLPPGPQGGD